MSISMRYAALSDVGLVRKNNQDGGYASPNLLVVADGMGGAAAGDVASSVAVSRLALVDDAHSADDLLPLLNVAVNSAHEDMIELVHENPKMEGMGTTCIALMRSNNKLAMVHIGDSRAYLLRDGVMNQMTHDHTLVQYLVDQGEITPEEAEHHPRRNVIMRALGDTPGEIKVDESVREARPGDRWLLCSDGLFGVVSHETIEHSMKNIPNLDQLAEHLVDLALAAGAPDNVTVIVADMIDDAEADPSLSTQPMVVGSAAKDWPRPTRGGDSAAAKAALLTRATGNEVATEKKDKATSDEYLAPKKHHLRRIFILFTLLVLLVMAGVGGYKWSQTRYYVTEERGVVVIYQGIPQNIGPLTLSHRVKTTDLKLEDLNSVAQNRLERPITRATRAQAEEVVEALRAQKRPTTPVPNGIPQANPGSPAPSTQANPGSPVPSTQPSLNAPSPAVSG
ncbi:Stp1/IreP family PP2C-type Ser/Thr phosphatase [Actinotignum urinale]|uniref:Stp1/IreP family PP2C-type Ser/Thr phosphatase n=1 Tax=Actinotignum urinale TaxID=190146 RepID=UPI000416D8E2|nr:Stp1/IreP family PP2C-type Ser/Thr phosphatase [Actinotignum urinale]MDY5160543.1 Stp1/IreP family PP2C-type Ser/Thr phosphatase [Actinotignum urinale]